MRQEILLIEAPNGYLEVDAIWQSGERTSQDFLAILCHPNPLQGGTMNNKVVSTMYRFCRDAGMDVFRFNFRGVGRSTGCSEYAEGEFIDALSVLRYALANTKARKLWLGGFSFGGFIACRLADAISSDLDNEFYDLQLHDLVLIAPSVVKNDTSMLTWKAKNSCLIYGSSDEIVPPDALEKFGKDRQLPSVVMPTGHFFHGKLVELKQILNMHFEK